MRYETRYVLHLFTSVFLNSFKDGFLSVVGEILYLKSTNEEKKKKVALLLINIGMESRNAKNNLSNTELFLFISLLFLMCFSELQFCLRLFIQTFDIREICQVFCQTECSSEAFTNIGVQCGLCVICQMSVLLLGKLSLGIEELWLQQRA